MPLKTKIIKIPRPFYSITNKIYDVGKRHGFRVYIVGGFLRDLLSGLHPDDLDLLVDGPGKEPAVSLGGILRQEGIAHSTVAYDKPKVDGNDFGVFKAIVDGHQVDLVMPRRESYNSLSRRPVDVYKTTIKGDAIRRDFTVNTLLYDPETEKILDPTGFGIKDLKNNYIRSANPDCDKMIDDDPLRILRAIRFMTVKKMKADSTLFEAMKRNSDKLRNPRKISWERIREEVTKTIMSGKKPSEGIRLLKEIGILDYIFPEFQSIEENPESSKYHKKESTYEHTLRALDKAAGLNANAMVRWALLFHDAGKPAVKAPHKKEPGRITFYGHETYSAKIAFDALKRFRFPEHEISLISALIGEHMFYHTFDNKTGDKAVRKHLYNLVPKAFHHEEKRFSEVMIKQLEDSMVIAEADKKGSGIMPKGENLKLKKYRERLRQSAAGRIPIRAGISGVQLMEMFEAPGGPWIKYVHDKLHNFQLSNPSADEEELLQIVKGLVAQKYPEYYANYKNKNKLSE